MEITYGIACHNYFKILQNFLHLQIVHHENVQPVKRSVKTRVAVSEVNAWTGMKMLFKGRVNPATISKPEFCIFFTILNMNMYSIITNINNSP